MDSHAFDITRVIQLAIAPVFLLSAIATIINVLIARLSRAVDRRRVLEEHLSIYQDEHLQQAISELRMLQKRITLTLWSVTLAVLAALLICLLVVAAVAGNTVNYAIGRWLGKRFFTDRGSRWLNPKHLEKAHAFYEHHGGKAVIISRFLPIVRTYIPFVAGLGAMDPGRFTAFNVVGAVLWVASLTYAGFFFGNIPWIKGNLTLIIVGIIAVSLVPVVWAWLKSRRES